MQYGRNKYKFLEHLHLVRQFDSLFCVYTKTDDLYPGTPELGGGRRGSCPPCLLLGGARGAKVPFKYKKYYITVSFQGAFS